MRLASWWIVLLVALLTFAPRAAADDDDDDDDRRCGPLPVRVQDAPCDPLDDPCEDIDDPQPACGNLYQRPKEVCLSVTHDPPGYSYDVGCWVKFALKEIRERTGLDDWNVRVDPPVRK